VKRPTAKLASDAGAVARLEALGRVIAHPIRVRILGILRHGGPHTQHELGKELSLSNAGIHYHLKILLAADLVALKGTRPGPNSIVEKLYEVNLDEWAALADATEQKNADIEFYVEYVLAWIQERNREGLEILKEASYAHPFIAGSYVVNAPPAEIAQLKRDLHQLLADFFSRYAEAQVAAGQSFGITFSVMPSQTAGGEHAQNVLQYDPDAPGPQTEGEDS